MSTFYQPDSEDVEIVCDSRVSSTHHQRVERRLLRSLVGQFIQQHSILILSICLSVILVQQVLIMYLAVMSHTSCFINLDNLAATIPSPVVSVTEPQISYEPQNVDKEHGCGYPNCDLRELKFRKLKSFARCQQCFKDLTVSRVYKEYHGEDFGIEFLFDYGRHVQNWNDNDWAAFSNITSEFEGSFRLIQYGDNSTQAIQWYNLRVKDGY